MAVGGTGVLGGGREVNVGGRRVAVGGRSVFVGGRGVLVGGRRVAVAVGRTISVTLEIEVLVAVPTESGGRVSRGRLVIVIHLVQVGVAEGVRVSVREAVNV